MEVNNPHLIARGVVVINTSLDEFERLVMDPERLFAVCDPKWTEAEVVQRCGPNAAVCYRTVHLPWPVKDRDCCWCVT